MYEFMWAQIELFSKPAIAIRRERGKERKKKYAHACPQSDEGAKRMAAIRDELAECGQQEWV
jgi:hypothetical protein